MRLKYPSFFVIDYPEENKKYYSTYSQPIIKEKLTNASSGYCMYCGNLLVNNGKNDGHIEHTIEKVQNGVEIEYLKHCKYNMSIACKTCNTSFKKNVKSIEVYENFQCPKFCYDICKMQRENITEYINCNQLITMPLGVYGGNESNMLEIEYELLKMNFVPSCDKLYYEGNTNLIESHIDRFKLNSEEFMPIDVIKVCESVVRYNQVPQIGDFKNVIADIFIKYLEEEIQDLNNINKVCKLIIIMNSL